MRKKTREKIQTALTEGGTLSGRQAKKLAKMKGGEQPTRRIRKDLDRPTNEHGVWK